MLKKLQFKGITLDNNIMTAPLAGYTDIPWRKVYHDCGASLIFTEMISVEALSRNNPKTFIMLSQKEGKSHSPWYCIQLFGNNLNAYLKSIEIIIGKFGYRFININMGCPVKKVLKAKSGCYFLENLDNASNIVAEIKKNFPEIILSIKTRTGISNDNLNGSTLIKKCVDNGADFIILHGRTKNQGFGGEVSVEKIKEIKKECAVPLIANGDITSVKKAHEMFEYTGCDGLMIGRGLFSDPFLVKKIISEKENISIPDNFLEKKYLKNTFEKHYNEMVKFYGRNYAYRLMKKFMQYYGKLYDKETKHKITVSESYTQFEQGAGLNPE